MFTKEAHETLPLPEDRQLTVVKGRGSWVSTHLRIDKQLVKGCWEREETQSYLSQRIARQLTITKRKVHKALTIFFEDWQLELLGDIFFSGMETGRLPTLLETITRILTGSRSKRRTVRKEKGEPQEREKDKGKWEDYDQYTLHTCVEMSYENHYISLIYTINQRTWKLENTPASPRQ